MSLLHTSIFSAAAVLLAAGSAQASIIPLGSALTFGGTNLPGACTDATCSDTTPFGGTVAIDGGALTLTTSQVADGPDAEWDVWRITTSGGAPVAGDLNGNWNITMSYVLGAAANFDAVVQQWSVGGTPAAGITNFGICCAVATNPSPLSGAAYYNSGFSDPLAAGPQSNWLQVYVNPYSYANNGNIPTATADGFAFGLHFTRQTPIPEPASLAILGAALAGLGLARRRG